VTVERIDTQNSFFAQFGVGRPHLLLDYDGTLAAFRVDRFQSRPWAGVREVLRTIQQEGKTRLAIITGRPAEEIGPMLGLDPPLEVWGLHGAERLYPDGCREMEAAAPAVQQVLENLREHLRRDSLGGLFEDKANGAVMHWRGHSRKKAAEIERRARDLFEPLARMEGLALLEFESGVELRVGRNKGGAVDAILAETDDGGPVAYLGDDLSDEAAFRSVQRLGKRGFSGLVRREWRESAAQVWMKPPAEVVAFLERWALVVDGSREVQTELFR
jgi:trehalose 6-phosphate synthase/trehalose 6-phosphate phosphatase